MHGTITLPSLARHDQGKVKRLMRHEILRDEMLKWKGYLLLYLVSVGHTVHRYGRCCEDQEVKEDLLLTFTV